jgi:hypothetical protein
MNRIEHFLLCSCLTCGLASWQVQYRSLKTKRLRNSKEVLLLQLENSLNIAFCSWSSWDFHVSSLPLAIKLSSQNSHSPLHFWSKSQTVFSYLKFKITKSVKNLQKQFKLMLQHLSVMRFLPSIRAPLFYHSPLLMHFSFPSSVTFVNLTICQVIKRCSDSTFCCLTLNEWNIKERNIRFSLCSENCT